MSIDTNHTPPHESSFKTSFTGKDYIINAWFLVPDATPAELTEAFDGRVNNASYNNIRKVLNDDIRTGEIPVSDLEDTANISVQNHLIHVMDDSFDDLEPQEKVPKAHQFTDFLPNSNNPLRDFVVNAWLLAPSKHPRTIARTLIDEVNATMTDITNIMDTQLESAALSETEIENIANRELQTELKPILANDIDDVTPRNQAPDWYTIHRALDDPSCYKKHALINIYWQKPHMDPSDAMDYAGCSITHARNVKKEMEKRMTTNEIEAALNETVRDYLYDMFSTVDTNALHASA